MESSDVIDIGLMRRDKQGFIQRVNDHQRVIVTSRGCYRLLAQSTSNLLVAWALAQAAYEQGLCHHLDLRRAWTEFSVDEFWEHFLVNAYVQSHVPGAVTTLTKDGQPIIVLQNFVPGAKHIMADKRARGLPVFDPAAGFTPRKKSETEGDESEKPVLEQ